MTCRCNALFVLESIGDAMLSILSTSLTVNKVDQWSVVHLLWHLDNVDRSLGKLRDKSKAS